MSSEKYGKFELTKRLATGGMAQIYLARQTGLEGFEKLMVVKRILPHLAENEDFITMFLDEARIAARLNHPNVVQIFDLGKQDDTYFIAMEYIHGEDVRRVWKRAEAYGRSLPIPLACRIIMESCAGLDYAHKKADQSGRALEIVHRDISPQNILVTFEGGVKVVDFGIAKAADQATVTRSGVLKGKYSYMSPEQASGKKIDSRTDIFALGVVLFELLTGRRLFKRTNDIQTLNAVTECNVPPPSEFVPGIPPDLDAIVLKALAKNPDERYLEAVHLQMALEDWLISHQYVSSSAHLAAFMQEIYADRLAEERQSGEPRPEPLTSESEKPSNSEEDKPQRSRQTPSQAPPQSQSHSRQKTPSGPPASGRPERSGSDRSGSDRSGSDRSSRDESTTAARPRSTQGGQQDPRPADIETDPRTRTVEPRPTRSIRATPSPVREARPAPREPEVPREKPQKPRRPRRSDTPVETPRTGRKAALLLGGAAIAALAVIGVVYSKPDAPPPLASIRVETQPPGATLQVDGRNVEGKTPLTLNELPEGAHQVELRLEGHEPQSFRLEVPRTGALVAGPYVLEPLPSAPDVKVQEPVEKIARVLFRIRSDPPGAKVSVDGREKGVAPVELEGRAGQVVDIRAVLDGHRNFERKVTLSDTPEQELLASLPRIRRVESAGSSGNTAPVARTGRLRVFVEPWGKVTCGGRDLGVSPFGDKTLPVGNYDCVITNDDYPPQKRKVEIRANELSKVIVRFEN